jgi:drug/metabolite transporter (DMT)-like permease
MTYIGEFAALFTSLCWSMAAIGFTFASRQVGSQVTNRVRVVVAFVALFFINWILYGQPIPFYAGSARWLWLMLSGVVGLAIGDAFLFRTYQVIGPRIGSLLMSMNAVFGAAIAWLFMGEKLTIMQYIGMMVTLLGIGWVVLTRPADAQAKLSAQGVLFGVLAALGQAGGIVLSKQGMAGDFPPFAGTIIRMIAAILVLWIMAFFQKQAGTTVKTMREHPTAWRWVGLGALFGPIIGVSASLLAVQRAEVGVASTLMALPPIFLLPISYFVFKERFSWQAVAGTLVAIAGVALLFLK